MVATAEHGRFADKFLPKDLARRGISVEFDVSAGHSVPFKVPGLKFRFFCGEEAGGPEPAPNEIAVRANSQFTDQWLLVRTTTGSGESDVTKLLAEDSPNWNSAARISLGTAEDAHAAFEMTDEGMSDGTLGVSLIYGILPGSDCNYIKWVYES